MGGPGAGRRRGHRWRAAVCGGCLLLACTSETVCPGGSVCRGSASRLSFFTIRPLFGADVARVRGLLDRARSEGDGSSLAWPRDDDFSREVLRYDGESGVMLVATSASTARLFACAAVTIGREESLEQVSALPGQKRAEASPEAVLRRVCVDLPKRDWLPGRRQKVLGALVVEAARFARAKRARQLHLEDKDGVLPSSKALRSLGFQLHAPQDGGAASHRYALDLAHGALPARAVVAAAAASQVGEWRPSFSGRWRADREHSQSLGHVLQALAPGQWSAASAHLQSRTMERFDTEQIVEQSATELMVREMFTTDLVAQSRNFVLPFNGTVTDMPCPMGSSTSQTTRWSRTGHKLRTVQVVDGDLFQPESALILETVRFLGDRGGASLLEDVRVIHSGKSVASARRVWQRIQG